MRRQRRLELRAVQPLRGRPRAEIRTGSALPPAALPGELTFATEAEWHVPRTAPPEERRAAAEATIARLLAPREFQRPCKQYKQQLLARTTLGASVVFSEPTKAKQQQQHAANTTILI